MSDDPKLGTIETDIPARLDRLPWSRWHWLIVIGLGTVWILDGLEVTIVGAVSAVLADPATLGLSDTQIGLVGGVYVAGACVGAIFFGHLTDRFGRRRLFMITLALYLVATVLTAFSFNVWWFFIMRFFTGAGIGGEYAAINSAIDELIPARLRGRVDLIINGSFWVGTAAGAALSIVLLNPDYFAIDFGWRLGFGLGAILGLGILLVRRNVPESPRWLFIHGEEDEAERVVTDVEEEVTEGEEEKLPEADETITVEQRHRIAFSEIARTAIREYPRRSVICFFLFVGQAFLYNAIFFTYAIVLTTFFKTPASSVGLYLIPFAVGNFLGPVILGPLFDTVGRRIMIGGTYILSGILLIVTGYLFTQEVLTATSLTAWWVAIFFFASAGASSAYLTASEVFPMETRALAIAFFYAIGTAAGGIAGPWLFGALVETGKESNVYIGYIIGASLMILAGIIQAFLGVQAEQKRLETIAEPLTAVDRASGETPRGRERGAEPQPVYSWRYSSGTRYRRGEGT